jgi:hypothetical protein
VLRRRSVDDLSRGIVKHLAGVEAEYFGGCIGRSWPEPMSFWDDDADSNGDMWATAEESPRLRRPAAGRRRAVAVTLRPRATPG